MINDNYFHNTENKASFVKYRFNPLGRKERNDIFFIENTI